MFMTMFTPVIFGPIKLLHLQRRSKKTVALEAANKIPKGPTDFPRFFARKVSLLLEVAIPLGAVLRDDCAGGAGGHGTPWDQFRGQSNTAKTQLLPFLPVPFLPRAHNTQYTLRIYNKSQKGR